MSDELRVEYCGEWSTVDPTRPFTIGRSGDLAVDDNPYLHRSFLEVRHQHGVWLLANVGRQLSATVGDEQSQLVAHLAPGGVVPLVVERTYVRFGAGPTTYELLLVLPDAPFTPARVDQPVDDGELSATTRVPAHLTPDQRLLVLALAEHALRRTGSGPTTLPTSGEAARRLGWSERKFNKKLDQVCQKLAKAGVRGLHGGPGDLAAGRRARLVEFCLASGLVGEDDLGVLDAPRPDAAD
ncbi:MAG: hypothetical protein ACO1PW_07820 [Actinomycetota bacterium]